MPERILEADLDAELLRRNRLGESHVVLARAFGCSKTLVQRRITRAAKLEESRLAVERERDKTVERHQATGLNQKGGGVTVDTSGSIRAAAHPDTPRDVILARLHDPKTSARDVASLANALQRLDAEETPAPDGALRMRLLAAKQRIRELEAAQFRLPLFMPGVDEWFDALPADVEGWTDLPGAPVELLDQHGEAHHVLPEDVPIFVEHLNWRTPPVFEPDDDAIEEMRALVAEHDARAAQPEPESSPLPFA